MLIIILTGVVAFVVLVSTVGLNKSQKPSKSDLAKLCDELSDSEAKFRSYMNKGQIDYAVDVTEKEISEVHVKMRAYKPEEIAKACGISVQAGSAVEKVARAAVPQGRTVPLKEREPSTGCTAAPFDVLPIGKPLTMPELTALMSRTCRVVLIRADKPMEIQWQDKTYLIGFSKSPGTGGLERYEITSIRAQ